MLYKHNTSKRKKIQVTLYLILQVNLVKLRNSKGDCYEHEKQN